MKILLSKLNFYLSALSPEDFKIFMTNLHEPKRMGIKVDTVSKITAFFIWKMSSAAIPDCLPPPSSGISVISLSVPVFLPCPVPSLNDKGIIQEQHAVGR